MTTEAKDNPKRCQACGEVYCADYHECPWCGTEQPEFQDIALNAIGGAALGAYNFQFYPDILEYLKTQYVIKRKIYERI